MVSRLKMAIGLTYKARIELSCETHQISFPLCLDTIMLCYSMETVKHVFISLTPIVYFSNKREGNIER